MTRFYFALLVKNRKASSSFCRKKIFSLLIFVDEFKSTSLYNETIN